MWDSSISYCIFIWVLTQIFKWSSKDLHKSLCLFLQDPYSQMKIELFSYFYIGQGMPTPSKISCRQSGSGCICSGTGSTKRSPGAWSPCFCMVEVLQFQTSRRACGRHGFLHLWCHLPIYAAHLHPKSFHWPSRVRHCLSGYHHQEGILLSRSQTGHPLPQPRPCPDRKVWKCNASGTKSSLSCWTYENLVSWAFSGVSHSNACWKEHGEMWHPSRNISF